MAVEVIMPKIDENMQEGTIAQWKKKEGEKVNKGEIIFVIETEKVTWEVEAEASGVLGRSLAEAGEVVPVGKVVVFILEPGEKQPDIVKSSNENKEEIKRDENIIKESSHEKKEGTSKLAKASPLAKKTAREYGIDIATIKGSGADGRITEEDVLKAIKK
ncbi:MAG: E3 binding domain-containing protein [Spirochaetota bacterium]|nr:MAG: E3 binding domain-containing protein [Spirochaetota bacterium]